MSPKSCIVGSLAQSPSLFNHSLSTDQLSQVIMEIEVGSIYRIDHSKLLPTSLFPDSLSSIKAVLVHEKSDEDVTILFPSKESLKRFFSKEKLSGLMQPNLDEKIVIDLNVCKKILTQKIPFEEFAAQRGTRSFWAVDFLDDDDHRSSTSGLEIKWGRSRRRATFSGKLRGERRRTGFLPCGVLKSEPSMAMSLNEERENDDDEDKEEEEDEDEDNVDDDDVKEEITEKSRKVKKRKCQFKGVKYTEKKKKKKKQVMDNDHDEKKPINPQHRWTNERYKLAEKNMLNIMKAKGAIPGNPILRPELRSEARKLIGDTGLLDHLLKHMAGKLAPGGKERFRRRHNPEGAMEYWLESADLVEIRKKAGIKDSYWVPPPGWKPGDSPTQDPVCARELKVLKEEVANMKREIGKLACRSEQANNDQALMAAGPGESFGRLNVEGSLKPLKELYEELMKKRAHVEKQLFDISKSLSGMEEEIGRVKGLTSASPKAMVTVDEKGTKGFAEEEKDNKKQGKRNGAAINEAETYSEQLQERENTPPKVKPDHQNQEREKEAAAAAPPPLAVVLAAPAATSEKEEREKQERRQRLKSGFRICKPQGTFLWPSNSSFNSNTSTYSLEDILGYPTPPSVSSSSSSSSTCRALIFPPPPPPSDRLAVVVKRPVAKRAAVTLSYSTTTIRGGPTTIESISSPTTTTTSSSSTITTHTHAHQIFVPDLNEAPPHSIISSFT